MVMCALLTVFVGKFLFSIVDIWSLVFKTKLFTKAAFGLSVLGIIACVYGTLYGRFNLSPRYYTVYNENLPEKFDGYKILQISDLHLASLYDHKKTLSDWIDLMNAENPDVIFFTGDFISVMAGEMEPHVEVLKRLKTPNDGKFAILGNHDYGDYHWCKSEEKRIAHFNKIQSLIKSMGFELLSNEHRLITRGGDTIAIVGVENGGRAPFNQHGDLFKAVEGLTIDTRIFLCHDPYFWDIYTHELPKCFLAFAGHTHAMQIGVEIGDWEISPSRFSYKYWHGLYDKKGLQIVVNRGMGGSMIPIRLGMSPEYVVVTLKK